MFLLSRQFYSFGKHDLQTELLQTNHGTSCSSLTYKTIHITAQMFNKSLSGLLLQKEKNSSKVPQSSFQVMATWQSDRWQKQWKILFSLCSHTSGNPRFNNFYFFKPQMNYHLPSKLSLISTTRISSSFVLSKNNLFFLCSTWEVWPYFSDAA